MIYTQLNYESIVLSKSFLFLLIIFVWFHLGLCSKKGGIVRKKRNIFTPGKSYMKVFRVQEKKICMKIGLYFFYHFSKNVHTISLVIFKFSVLFLFEGLEQKKHKSWMDGLGFKEFFFVSPSHFHSNSFVCFFIVKYRHYVGKRKKSFKSKKNALRRVEILVDWLKKNWKEFLYTFRVIAYSLTSVLSSW